MKILVTKKIPGNHIEKLKEGGHDVIVSELDRSLTPDELLEKGKGMDGLLSLLTDKIDGEVIDAIGPQLKIISNYAVGFDNIDIPAATEKGVVVTNTPSDEVNEAVAEHTWALMLSMVRRVVEADEAVRRGAYHGWEPDIFVGSSLKGKILGIIGMGRIGSMVARRAKGFDMQVLYNKRSPDHEAEKELGIKFATIEELLAYADVVSLHVPLNEETRHMMNPVTLSKMKPGSYLINTARGPVVDEHALVDALRSGHLAGAGIDVFDNEPNVHPELIGMENVVLTPHIASATHEAREKMGELAVQAILDVLAGKQPKNLANPDVWDKRRQ